MASKAKHLTHYSFLGFAGVLFNDPLQCPINDFGFRLSAKYSFGLFYFGLIQLQMLVHQHWGQPPLAMHIKSRGCTRRVSALSPARSSLTSSLRCNRVSLRSLSSGGLLP